MAGYLALQMEDEDAHASQSPKEMAALIEAHAAFEDALRRAGRLKDSGRLRPSLEGKRVRRQADAPRVTDGPFTEEGRALAGYAWIEADSVEDAAKLAQACPTLAGDAVDVRPVMKARVPAGKDAKPGKVFACAVLGSAPTEEAWVEVMDRIDAEPKDDFAGPSFPGGLRLQPPRRGLRIATRGERRAVFDGPFLESKEVIGGLFFVRMASIDDVVRWAVGTRFLAHGALEIRELWRT